MNGSSVTEGSRFCGHALPISVLVHVIEQPADVLAGEVALERPRGVGVAERHRHVGHAAEHHALVAHRLGQLDLAAVDRELCPPSASRFRPVAVTTRSASSSAPDRSRIPSR